jgi:S-DNA-T family DNA segregation ATPase FtsK/SpoIIIE
MLREGPAVGVFTLVWCDTLNNLQRALDRQALREFEMRVLFQMSAADSSNLIDSPQASKLGLHRAFYYSEDQGRLEKFRPYGAVTEPWLEVVRRLLAPAFEKQSRSGAIVI